MFVFRVSLKFVWVCVRARVRGCALELISLFCEFVCMLFRPCMASICVLEESLNVCPVMFLLSAVSVVVLPGCLPLPVPLMCQCCVLCLCVFYVSLCLSCAVPVFCLFLSV